VPRPDESFAMNGLASPGVTRAIAKATLRWPGPDPVGATADERIRLGHARPGAVGPLVRRRRVAYSSAGGPPRDAEIVAPSRLYVQLVCERAVVAGD
jgi:hypothetical protein